LSRDDPGKLALADRGAIFLDNIGELTPYLQRQLVRFLDTGQKVDAAGLATPLDVRVMVATSRSLRQLMAVGTFRPDLFYRLDVIHITVPALRERREDIPELVAFFLEQFTTITGSVVRSMSPEALDVMQAYSWPGNVRELSKAIERLVVTGSQAILRPEDLPAEIRMPGTADPLRPERRRTVADDLFEKLTEDRASFWTTVYPLYMQREITRGHVRDVVRRGLEEARGNYNVVAQLFNMEQRDYKRFLSFLRKHDCHVPISDYR
jgi:DNA-binding NtrC family response regulator